MSAAAPHSSIRVAESRTTVSLRLPNVTNEKRGLLRAGSPSDATPQPAWLDWYLPEGRSGRIPQRQGRAISFATEPACH
jgi:hypothetical protein